MKFERRLSKEGVHPERAIQWKTLRLKLAPSDAEPTVVEVPAEWSDTAAQIIVTKYFRKAGVPNLTRAHLLDDMPQWLKPSKPWTDYLEFKLGPETSAKQLFHRLAGAWTYHGWKMGLFDNHETVLIEPNPEHNARIFYDELYLILARQLAAPNSPQWFNTGLWWAYGIEGPKSGQWAVEHDMSKGDEVYLSEAENAYEHPQPHACFIQPVTDDLVNPGGIMDLWTREVRLFKQGSGTGTNFSTIRAKGERLSGGGVSSGLMSFLEIGDRAAGSIASGGVTRRAAKMVVVDADHPEIEDFIDWKCREEQKAAAMWLGSKVATDYNLRKMLPPELSERVSNHMPTEVFSIDYEGEAIRTVGGQNANNTVRVTDNFMQKLNEPQGALWYLKERTTGKLGKSMQATYLWNKICHAAWASADPGLQFHDTINKWHTCKADGEIRASNPCSEYMFLDNTACNLASLNLGKFYVLKNLTDPRSYEFDLNLFCHVARLMTIVLDISVTMASFPSREIALGSYNYRTLGLGYANLGGLLMRMGLPYDSNEGRQTAAAITALLTGVAYLTSESLATELGAFPRWKENSSNMAEVMGLHFKSLEKLEDTLISTEAKRLWYKVSALPKSGFRNAQVTLLAPTGTIGLLMDCDTLGIEPDFALVKHKNLAGGGTMTLVNEGVKQALLQLGYQNYQANLILAYVKEHETVEGCADLKPEHLAIFDCATPPQGFTRSIVPMGHVLMMAAVQPFLSGAISKTANMPNSATVEDVSQVYMAAWKLGLKAIAIYRDESKLAQPLQAGTQKEQEAKKSPVREKDGIVTIEEFSPGVTLESPGKIVPSSEIKGELFPLFDQGEVDSTGDQSSFESTSQSLDRGVREYLPWRRESAYTQKVNINGQSVHLTVGRYPDGRAGEVRLDLSRVGTTLSAVCDMVAMMISIGLQYGVPVEEYVQRLSDRKFEPSGLVEGHENIKYASSIGDFIARELGLTFLGRTDMGQVKDKPTLRKTAEEMVKTAEEIEKILEDVGIGQPSEEARTGYRCGLEICPDCGEAALTRSGTCQTCTNCGFNDGCGG